MTATHWFAIDSTLGLRQCFPCQNPLFALSQHPRPVRARPSAGEERDRLWQRWVAVDPRLDAYAVRRSTETPVIVLEPRSRTA